MFSKGEVPVLRLLVPFITGIMTAYYLPGTGGLAAAKTIAFASLTSLALLIIYYKRLSLYRNSWLAGIILHLFILAMAHMATVKASGRLDEDHYTRQRGEAFLAEVISEPRQSGKILRFEGRMRRCYENGAEKKSAGKISISVSYDLTDRAALQYGDMFLMPAVIAPVDPPFNPGEFDYRSYLADRQIYAQAFLEAGNVYLISRNNGNPVISFALGLRAGLVSKLSRYMGDASAAAFASALILGYRADLGKDLVGAYSATGTMHVLSVSGMHVGIVFLVLSFLLKFMDRGATGRLLRAAIIILCIWFYALVTGFSAPANRAAVMLSFVILGKALNRKQNTYNLLAISALFLLLYNPFYLFDAGFQLSYLAVTGLVYFHPRIYRALYVKSRFLDEVWSYCALSLAAQLATFPLSIYYFHQFPVYFLLSNLLIVLPVALVMYAGIALLFIPYPPVLYALGGLLRHLINGTNDMLFYIQHLPSSRWGGIWISSAECLLICLVLVCSCAVLFHGYRKLIWPLGLMLLILTSGFSLRRIRAADNHELIFFNLRKKSAMAYISGEQSTIISDLHPADKQVDFSVLPAVQQLGSRRQRFYSYADSAAGPSFIAAPNFYQFGNYKIVRWDKQLDSLRFGRVINVDAVVISGNPRRGVKQISAFVRSSRVIIDANNPEYKVQQWLAEAAELRLPCYVLKKNNALIVKL